MYFLKVCQMDDVHCSSGSWLISFCNSKYIQGRLPDEHHQFDTLYIQSINEDFLMLLSLFLLQSFTLRMKWTTFCERFDISNTPTIKVWTIEVRVPVNIPENNYKILFSSKLCFSFSIKIFHWTVIVWWGLMCGVDNCIVKHYYKQYVNIFSTKYELILFMLSTIHSGLE